MRITIQDVARAAGVSISTVSKVLNGHYSISEQTAEHVRQVMREMNYHPSANAQNFASGANRMVALLADMSPNTAFRNPHMFEIIAGLEEALQKRGYHLILQGTNETSACGAAEEIISRRSADAIAIHVGVMSHPLSAVLTRSHFPHIVLGMPEFESQVCWIDNSNTYSGTVAASYLLSQGYRRIAFIGGRHYVLASAHRRQGVKQGLSHSGISLEEQYIWLGESTRADGFQMTSKLLEQKLWPDAIICANNHIALGCVEALGKRGIQIPEQIGVMAFDDYPFSQMIEPPLTVVDINVRDMGAQAAKFLIDMMKHPNTQIQTYITTSNVIPRASTKMQRQL